MVWKPRKPLRGTISQLRRPKVPLRLPLLGHAALVWGRACFAPLLPSVHPLTHPQFQKLPTSKTFYFMVQ